MDSITERVKEALLRINGARLTSGGRNVTIRCQYCGDSKKSMKSAHLGILLPTEKTPALFHCVRCGASGILDTQKLLEYGIDDPQLLIEMTTHTKKVMSLAENKMYRDRKVYYINNNFISMNENTEQKLNYLRQRIGYNLTYQDCIDNKIVLNLGDLLESNHITSYTRHENVVRELDSYFLGFISVDNAFINMRNLNEGNVLKCIDNRYINYNIFGKFDNTERYYVLPTYIDICNPNRIKIHIAEGPLDILSIYFNLRKTKNQNVYGSILGSSYLSLIKHFIITMGFINCEIHIYKDNDIEYVHYSNYLEDIADLLMVYQIPVYVHQNVSKGEKDFGVPPERIKEVITRLT